MSIRSYHIRFWCLCAMVVIVSCSPIPKKSVFAKLSDEELNASLQEPYFEEMYRAFFINHPLSETNDITRIKHMHITYRDLYNCFKTIRETMYKYITKADYGWTEDYGTVEILQNKLDSVLYYWKDYISVYGFSENTYLPNSIREIVDRAYRHSQMNLYQQSMDRETLDLDGHHAFNLLKDSVYPYILPCGEYECKYLLRLYRQNKPDVLYMLEEIYPQDQLASILFPRPFLSGFFPWGPDFETKPYIKYSVFDSLFENRSANGINNSWLN